MTMANPASSKMDEQGNLLPPAASDDLLEAIRAAHGKVTSLREQRAAIQAEIQEELESLAAKGIPKKAFKAAADIAGKDDDQLVAFDLAYGIVRRALGKPSQVDAFDEHTTH